MGKSSSLMAIRYISIFIAIFDMIILKNNRGIISIVFILIYIINNNVRVFYLKKEALILSSILIELAGACIGAYIFKIEIIFLLIGIAIDLYKMKSMYLRCFLMICIIGSSAIIGRSLNYTIILAVLLLLLNYINELYSSKVEAQRLYDKLRISEEKLKDVNRELEEYALSIEELTLLKERNRISREIHDSVGHALSTTMIQLNAMEALLKKEENPLSSMANNLRSFVNESLQDVRLAVREIKPENYSSYEGILSIRNVFRNFEKMSKITVEDFVSKVEWELSQVQVANIYRISQEVLSNSLRHGKATLIRVIINFTEDDVVISFKDNGVGTDEILEKGIGLKGIKERVREMNGSLDIESKKELGFFIKIVIPKERG